MVCSMADRIGPRAVLSASFTIYRWQNAAKYMPQRVTGCPSHTDPRLPESIPRSREISPVYRHLALFTCRSCFRSCSTRQFRHRHPAVSPAFKTGIGPGGNSAHQQPPSGLQLMGASQRAHRVSMAPFSPIAAIGPMPRHTQLSAQFVPRLTQLRICGKLIVYAAWFLRAVA